MRWLVHAVVTAHSPCPSHIRMRPDGSYSTRSGLLPEPPLETCFQCTAYCIVDVKLLGVLRTE